MITMGIAVGAGLCYWFEWYGLAFWIFIYAIVYGGLSAVRRQSNLIGIYGGDQSRAELHDVISDKGIAHSVPDTRCLACRSDSWLLVNSN